MADQTKQWLCKNSYKYITHSTYGIVVYDEVAMIDAALADPELMAERVKLWFMATQKAEAELAEAKRDTERLRKLSLEQAYARDDAQRELELTFSKEQIAAGIKLASDWYEAWRLDELEPEQIIEAIEKATAAMSSSQPPAPTK